jgi:hypothetical protein
MKKLLIILVLLSAFSVNAQLVVKEAAKDTTIWQPSKLQNLPKLIRFKTDDLESYTMYYKNAKYTSITDIDYISIGDLETTKQFFGLCKTVISEGKEFNLTLGKESIMLKKSMGGTMIWKSGSYFYLTDKQIDSILLSL